VPVEPLGISYPLEVRLEEPCACRWPRTAALADIEREVLDHVRRTVAELRDAPRLAADATILEILETADTLTVRVGESRDPSTAATEADLVLLLAKGDLRLLQVVTQRPHSNPP
jgi:hypothetical protein